MAARVEHAAAHARLVELRQAGHDFGIAPQVFAAFVHVVTDGRRFTEPLSIQAAMERRARFHYFGGFTCVAPSRPGST